MDNYRKNYNIKNRVKQSFVAIYTATVRYFLKNRIEGKRLLFQVRFEVLLRQHTASSPRRS
jgi:hypothetical protein